LLPDSSLARAKSRYLICTGVGPLFVRVIQMGTALLHRAGGGLVPELMASVIPAPRC
jgi:hypothetical protein